MSFLAELIDIVRNAIQGGVEHAHHFAARAALNAAMIFAGLFLLVGAAALLIAAFYLALVPGLGVIPALLLCSAAAVVFAAIFLVIAFWRR